MATRKTPRSTRTQGKPVEVPVPTDGSSARPGHAAPGPIQRNSADQPWISRDDVFLFNEGTHYRLADKLGAHLVTRGGEKGVMFAVWAPSARYVAVVGDFNNWDRGAHPMRQVEQSGIWEAFIPGIGEGAVYKYHIASQHDGYTVDKADPVGFMHEVSPKTASIVRGLEYRWNDGDWMATRAQRNDLAAPMSVYEVHLGSWMRSLEDQDRHLTYRELAPRLAEHVGRMGFTHVEFLPVMEHPFYASWGYQTTGYFAPTSRYGTPQDFMYLIDHLHQHGIGVILDWVPSHFPTDEHGLGYFDGTHLFEHQDARQGFHPDWKSSIFNYGRHEVRAFLISSAIHWLDKFHADGLRVDAVASMLYLDYGRKHGEWIPNRFGGRENLDAVEFLRQFNTEVYRSFPDVQTIAEESTAWPMVSRPVYLGGLGFGLKWDMGWMHDCLSYFKQDPVHRRFHHQLLTFRAMYQSSENYMLPLSHDEVVHLKGSLLSRQPGDEWQRFANLRLVLANQYMQPGKKLLFMGGEFGHWREWNHDASLDWHLVADEASPHSGILRLVVQLNRLHREIPALFERDCLRSGEGFEWIEPNDAAQSVTAFLRRGEDPRDMVVILFNHTPVPRHNYRIGVPLAPRPTVAERAAAEAAGVQRPISQQAGVAPETLRAEEAGAWVEILNTDAREFGGSGMGNLGRVVAAPTPSHGRPCSLNLTLPPLAAVVLRPEGKP